MPCLVKSKPKMLTVLNLQPKIVEKIVYRNGTTYRICAEFSCVGGKVLGRIISIERIQAISEFSILNFQ